MHKNTHKNIIPLNLLETPVVYSHCSCASPRITVGGLYGFSVRAKYCAYSITHTDLLRALTLGPWTRNED